MKLTKIWLQSNANPTSFSRGKGYQDAVRKLKKDGDVYTAKVDGSDTYKVEIIEAANEIHTECSCPYDYDGICKHVVAVGLEIIAGNFKEVKTTEPIVPISVETIPSNAVIDALFYDKEFLKARKNKQEAFIRQLFTQDASVRQQFLTYINPPPPPLSISTNIDELCKEIVALIAKIDLDDYIDEDNDYHNEHHYDYDDEEQYDTSALEEEVARVLEPYGKKVVQTLNKGQLMDSIRVVLAIYEASFLVQELDLGEYTDFTFGFEVSKYFEEVGTNWLFRIEGKDVKKSDFEAILTLILERWERFKKSKTQEEVPYAQLDEDFFYAIVQKAEAENRLLDFMTEHKLHTAAHYELTKKLCTALNKGDFLLDRLAEFGMNSAEIAKELMLEYIKRDNRHRFVAVAKDAYEKFQWQIQEFIAEQVLATDDLVFFKKILSEVAARQERLDLFQRWREHVTPLEQEAYLDVQKKQREGFYITLLADAKRFSDILIFAEQNVEKLNSNTFETAAEWVINVYPNEIFPLYCERVLLFMGNNSSGRDHYQQAVEKLKPVKKMKGKEADIKAFGIELRKKYNRLPAFLDELKKGGF